jgi:Ni/Co efflux regulator RcnB
MNKKFISSAILTICMAMTASASFAQNHERRDNSRGQNSSHADRNDRSARSDRGNTKSYKAHDHRDSHAYQARPGSYRGHGAGPAHNFYRGGRLPARYRSGPYIVRDWRGHRLSAPPRGYYWVQAGNDFVLAAIATGIIAQVILSH